jgi:hypothetical protein
MRLPRERFTTRRMMVAVAAVALVLGILVYCLRWLQYPHINVTIFNETSTPIFDVRVTFMLGERTAERLGPGGVAVAVIQSGGDAGIFFSYRDSGGIIRKAEPLYDESGNRGYLEIHVSNEGVRLVNGIYRGDQIPILGIRRVRPTGQMTVR